MSLFRRRTLNLGAGGAVLSSLRVPGAFDWFTIARVVSCADALNGGNGTGTFGFGLSRLPLSIEIDDADPIDQLDIGDVIEYHGEAITVKNLDTSGACVVELLTGMGRYQRGNLRMQQDSIGELLNTERVTIPFSAADAPVEAGVSGIGVAFATNTKGVIVHTGHCFARGDGAAANGLASIGVIGSLGGEYDILQAVSNTATTDQASASLCRQFLVAPGLQVIHTIRGTGRVRYSFKVLA